MHPESNLSTDSPRLCDIEIMIESYDSATRVTLGDDMSEEHYIGFKEINSVKLSMESTEWRRRIRSMSPILNFKRRSSGILEDLIGPDMDPEADDGGFVQSSDNLLSMESTEWRRRIRSMSPILNFKRRSSGILEDLIGPDMDPEADDGGFVQSSDNLKREKEIQHGESGMETLLKHLPTATSAGLFTASCLLLLPLIIFLRRYS